MKKILFILFSITTTVSFSQNPSGLKEYKKVFKTYGFSDPDPIARMGSIYPYYRFDGYTDVPLNKEWKVVELENDFIRVMILPEIGGKIWGAWEKSTGRPFLYYNQVVKFRDVAMRGPWTSGGIEPNYGIIGHTPNCATPVDYLTKKKDDGSVSCYIGTLDLLTETYWTIEINLPKDKAYFTTRSFWNNTSFTEQPYYTWMNTGVKAAGDLEFIYPGTRYIGHEGEYADWKINKENGKDISFYEQNNFGGYKSYHVFGKYTDFFGAYWHRENFGMGRYSLHDEKAGKKIWIWGLSPQGMIWEKLLTDTDGQYVEVQSGRMFNQASPGSSFTPFKHTSFIPATSDTWTEYWFPVMNTKGFVKANEVAAINVRAQGGFLKIDISPLQNLKETLTVYEGDRPLYSKVIELNTLKVFSDSLQFSGNANDLIVKLGASKLEYRSNAADGVLSRPVDSPAGFDWSSTYGLYVLGMENLRQRFYVPAEQKFKECLAKDPNYLPALSSMSMLMFRNMEYQKSLDYARHALSIDTYDPAANYYYGLTNLQLGNITDAKDGFDIAALSTEYRGAAFTALSKIYFKESDYSKAVAYANKSLEVNTNNTEAYQLQALAYRLMGNGDKTNDILSTLKKLNPLNHFIGFEQYRLEGSEANAAHFTATITNELPHETFLHLADWYYSIGQLKEALEVLRLAPANPEVYYFTAFLKDKLKEEDALTYLDKANSLSPQLVFPFRQRDIELYTWVISHSQHWKPKYYLGLVYWSRNNPDRARELFTQCGNPDFSPFYAARAALLQDKNFAADLKQAALLNPVEWRYGKLLVNHFVDTKNYTEALATANQYKKRFPQDFRISMLLAKALLLNKQYKACSDLLEKTTILPYEGATDGRQLYREAWLMQGIQQIAQKNYKSASASINKARQWPERLGVGKPYDEDIDARIENYLDGIILERSTSKENAIKKWNEVAAFKTKHNNANTLLTALALKKIGKGSEGEKLLVDWAESQHGNALAKWCFDSYNNQEVKTDVNFEDDSFRIIKEIVHL